MKKLFISFAAIAILGSLIFLSSCKKDDTSAPTLTLKGDATITIDLGDTYTDLGATANDDKDGDISSKVKVQGIPANTNEAGEYTITYNVEDAAGNTATELTRILYIRTNKLAGQYDVKESNDIDTTTTPYNITVTQSSTAYNKLIISNFGAYGNSILVDAIVDKADISIPAQSFTVSGIKYTISGSGGTYDGSPSVFKLLTIKYNSKWTDSGTNYDINFTATIKKKY
jgi:hypothetical protein